MAIFREWTFRGYQNNPGKSVIDSWYHAQNASVRAAFDTRLKYLKYSPPSQWVRPYVGALEGECDGLFEIRFKADKIQYRPLGFYDKSKSYTFIIVIFAIEKGGRLIPPSACKAGLIRKKSIEGGGITCEWRVL